MRVVVKSPPQRAAAKRVSRVVLRGDRAGNQVTIARLVLSGRPPTGWRSARQLLLNALARWPNSVASTFLLLPGGFISHPWPQDWTSGWGWNSADDALAVLRDHVAHRVSAVLDAEVRKVARERVKAIAFGIDVGPDKNTGAVAELAVVYDLESAAWSVTGKSFLRGDQSRVVRINNLASHFLEVGGERTLILGCHDLNIFSPRGRSAQQADGPLARLRQTIDRSVELFAPTVALQLPHGTDTPRTWIPAWKALAGAARLRAWASGIAFYHPTGGEERATLDEVCEHTYGGEPCLDFIA